MVGQFGLADRLVRVGDHERDRYLAVDGVGGSDHRALEHRRMGGECVLDLLGVEVLSTADDHVLDAIDQGEIPVGVEGSDVAGV